MLSPLFIYLGYKQRKRTDYLRRKRPKVWVGDLELLEAVWPPRRSLLCIGQSIRRAEPQGHWEIGEQTGKLVQQLSGLPMPSLWP
jgi:hypothetical protein